MVKPLPWWPTMTITKYAVRASHCIYMSAKRLGQSDSEPMGMFVNKFGIKKYLTGGKIAKVL